MSAFQRSLINPLRFVRIWTINALSVWIFAPAAYFAFIFISVIFIRAIGEDTLPAVIMILLVVMVAPGLITGLVLGRLQQNVLHRNLYWILDGWVTASAIGGAIGSIVLMVFTAMQNPELYDLAPWDYSWMSYIMPMFIFFVSTAQWVVLRRVVKSAWIWVVGNIVAAMVFNHFIFPTVDITMSNDWINLITLFLAPTLQGAITGVVMLHIFEYLSGRPVEEKKLAPEPIPVKNDSPSVWDDAI